MIDLHCVNGVEACKPAAAAVVPAIMTPDAIRIQHDGFNRVIYVVYVLDGCEPHELFRIRSI